MVPSFRSFSFRTPGPRLEELGSGGDVKMNNEAGKASQILHLTSLGLPWCLFFIPTISFNHLRIHTIAKKSNNAKMWQLCPANYICRSSLRSLSPHIPPLPSQAHWPPHLHPHGGARGGSCHCDGWVSGQALGQHQRLVGWQEARHSLVGMEGAGQHLLVFDLGSGKVSAWYCWERLERNGIKMEVGERWNHCEKVPGNTPACLNKVKCQSLNCGKACVRQPSKHEGGWHMVRELLNHERKWTKRLLDSYRSTGNPVQRSIDEENNSKQSSRTSWQPKCKVFPLSNHFLGHTIAAQHPTSQFQVYGFDSLLVTIRRDHDTMIGGGCEGHRIINPQFAGACVTELHLRKLHLRKHSQVFGCKGYFMIFYDVWVWMHMYIHIYVQTSSKALINYNQINHFPDGRSRNHHFHLIESAT